MNNNRLLKIYLSVAAASIVLFAITFVAGLNAFDNINSLVSATLPFVITTVVSLLCFGFTPVKAQAATVKRTYRHSNVVRLNPCPSDFEEYTVLDKIS